MSGGTEMTNLEQARDRVFDECRDFWGVNGVGIGRKDDDCDLGVVVFVSKKRAMRRLPESEVLPTSVIVDGVQVAVSVVEGGPFELEESAAPKQSPPEGISDCGEVLTADPRHILTLVRPRSEFTSADVGRPVQGGDEFDDAGEGRLRAYGVVAICAVAGTSVLMKDVAVASGIATPADSGRSVRFGGSGEAPLAMNERADVCPALRTVGREFDVALVKDQQVFDNARDRFFSKTRSGKYIIDLFYANMGLVQRRCKSHEPNSVLMGNPPTLYQQQMRPKLKMLASPTQSSQNPVFDSGFVGMMYNAQTALNADGYITSREAEAFSRLIREVIEPSIGMRKGALRQYMNRPAVFQKARRIARSCPTINQPSGS